MAFLDTAGEYEAEINRGILSMRSSRLSALVAAIAEFIATSRRSRLLEIERRLDTWKQSDPKEFADRGQGTEQALRQEVADLLASWGDGEIRIVNPDDHPVYEPAKWNDNGLVQQSTNCYAYACDDAFQHPYMEKPQPGELGGLQLREAEHSAVRLAVMVDDQYRNANQLNRLVPLIRLRDDPIPNHAVNIAGYYLIALVTAPGADYHWLRQDRDGMWSHKPGWGQATCLDSAGQLIADPRDAVVQITDDTGIHDYLFTTFYYAPKGGVRTGDLGLQKRKMRRATF